jgi:hypothetical protein
MSEPKKEQRDRWLPIIGEAPVRIVEAAEPTASGKGLKLKMTKARKERPKQSWSSPAKKITPSLPDVVTYNPPDEDPVEDIVDPEADHLFVAALTFTRYFRERGLMPEKSEWFCWYTPEAGFGMMVAPRPEQPTYPSRRKIPAAPGRSARHVEVA